jgi:alkanesulfonate monooxygenase
MEILWNINTTDGRYPWRPEGTRKTNYQYFQQAAISVDRLGFTGALVATAGHDVWVMASSMMPFTKQMKFLCAVHPGLISPTLLAKMSASFDQFSNGRLMINIVNGDEKLQLGYGLNLGHDQRYEMTGEYLKVWRSVIAGEKTDFSGKYIKVTGGQIYNTSVTKPHPPLWFGGSSPAALDAAARDIDLYLSWGEPPPQAGEKFAAVRKLAEGYGRKMRFGVRLYCIVRETDDKAWAACDELLEYMDEETIARVQDFTKGSDSIGQARMSALLGGGRKPKRARDLEVYPDMWSGMGLVRPGPGTAIVGSPKTVAKRMEEFMGLGADAFIFSAYPLVEEGQRVAELLFPAVGFTPKRPDDATARDRTAPVMKVNY